MPPHPPSAESDPILACLPPPQRLERQAGGLQLGPGPVELVQEGTADGRARSWLSAGLAALELPVRTVAGRGTIALVLRGGGPPEAWRLTVADQRAELAAASGEGLLRGVGYLRQLLRAARPGEAGPRRLPAGVFESAPALARRGALLDVSRDRVPTEEGLATTLERLAELGANELQLHVEHTFAFPGHAAVWRGADPLTGEELHRLDARARALGVELVPHLQSFGHMHRWLVHERYRSLAECPAGVEHPFSAEREPFSLCATDPRALDFLAELYDEYLTHFTSRRFHVGCDETFDLGQGRSREACAARGRGRVFLDFVAAVAALVRERGCTPLVWADGLLEHRALAAELPTDVVPVAWGYEAGHPFERELPHLAAPGRRFQVAAGTSSWASLLGRSSNALANAAEAARAARAHGAEGLVVCDWGDWGHWQPEAVAWPGLAAGLARAWHPEASLTPAALADWLDVQRFGDRSRRLGRVLLELGELEAATGARAASGTSWFALLRHPDRPLPLPRVEDLSAAGLARLDERAAELAGELGDGPLCAADGALLCDELLHAVDLTRFAARLGRAWLPLGPGARLAQLPPEPRVWLGLELLDLAQRLRDLWRRRSRPGGLEDSVRRLLRVYDALMGP